MRQPQIRTVTPAEAARAILTAMFGDKADSPPSSTPPNPPAARTAGLAPFQHTAVQEAERILARRGGVLIADPVGMGKTRIGAALAGASLATGRPTLVVVPAQLRRQWAGALGHLRKHSRDATAPLRVVSHTDLSRDAGPDDDTPFGRVVVDEAHAFRNPHTRRYAALARLTRTADVVLLTATPINNSLLDLYFLIRLFAGDGAFADLGSPDLGRLFRLASLAPDAPPAPALSAVLREVTIRRTRAEVGTTHLPAGMRFPERAAPHTVRYEMTPAFLQTFDRALRAVEELHLAPYALDGYGLTNARAGAAPLLRLLLAKRLESGIAAFRQSVTDLILRLTDFREALEHGFLRPPNDSRRQDRNGAQLLLEELLFRPLPPGADRHRLAADTDRDLESLQALANDLAHTDDPKAAALEALLFTTLAGQRVLVFTEFRDTAADLWRRFCHRGGVAAIHGTAAWLGTSTATRSDVIRRFAPHANRTHEPPPHEAVRILFATDVLSEGLNLQDAAHVVSYDLPWNPVRLIQRIGRIDRLDSHHHTVHAYHFLPGEGLERLLGLVERIRQKLAAIRHGLAARTRTAPTSTGARGAGEVTREIADETDTRGLVERLASGDATLLDDLDRLDAAPLHDTARLRLLWQRIRPPTPSPQRPGPSGSGRSPAALIARLDGHMCLESEQKPAALIALHTSGRIHLVEAHDNGRPTTDARNAVPILELALGLATRAGNDTPPLPDTLIEYNSREAAEKEAAEEQNRTTVVARSERARIRRYIAQATRAVTPPAGTTLQPRRRGAPAHQTLRRLRLAAAAAPGGPDPELCLRIDRLTAYLARGLRAGHEATLTELLDRWHWDPPPDAHTACTQVENALHMPPHPRPATTPSPPDTHPIALILLA